MKRMTEKQTRKRILSYAKQIGALEDITRCFAKWDKMIAEAGEGEREDMAKWAILEVQSLLDIHAEKTAGLTINDKVVIPNNQNWKGEP